MNCATGKIPITILEGGTFNVVFHLKMGSPPALVDLTGYTARMAIRAKITDVAAILELVSQPGEWEADGASGIYIGEDGGYRIYIRDEDTQGICAAHKDIEGIYDLFFISPQGESLIKQYGPATLIAAVTR